MPKGFSSGVLALSCPTTCDPVCGFDGAVGMAMRQGREDGIGDERWNFLGKVRIAGRGNCKRTILLSSRFV